MTDEIFHKSGIIDGNSNAPAERRGCGIQIFIPSLDPARSHAAPDTKVAVPISAAIKSGTPATTGIPQQFPSIEPAAVKGGSRAASVSASLCSAVSAK